MNVKTAKVLRNAAKTTLLVCVILLLGLGIYYTYLSIRFRPYKVRVSNVTDSAFTVSWVTDEPMVGVVYYGDKDSFLPGPLSWLGKKRAFDDRDVSDAQTECVSKFNKKVSKNRDENFTVDASGFDCNEVKVIKKGQYYTHHVTVPNLDADKEYYFRVGNGYISFKEGKIKGVAYIEREMPTISKFQQRTRATIKEISSPNPAYGTSYNVFYGADGQVGTKKSFDSVIFLRTFKGGVEYPLMSAVTNSDGGWSIDLANVRDSKNNILAMEDTYLEFIPQVDNARPGASGTTRFEKLSFPLNLMGNDIDDLNKEVKKEEGELGRLLRRLVDAVVAYDMYDETVQCWSIQGCEYRIFQQAQCPTGYTSDKTKCNKVKPPSKENNPLCCTSLCVCTQDYVSCPVNYTEYLSKTACQKDKETKTKVSCCTQIGTSSCTCVSGYAGQCPSTYPKEYSNPSTSAAKTQCIADIPKVENSCYSYNLAKNTCTGPKACTTGTMSFQECEDKRKQKMGFEGTKTCCKVGMKSVGGTMKTNCDCLSNQTACSTGYAEYLSKAICESSNVVCKSGCNENGYQKYTILPTSSGGGVPVNVMTWFDRLFVKKSYAGAPEIGDVLGTTIIVAGVRCNEIGDDGVDVGEEPVLCGIVGKECSCWTPVEGESFENADPEKLLGHFGTKKRCEAALQSITTGLPDRCNGNIEKGAGYTIEISPRSLKGACVEGESQCYVGIRHTGKWNITDELCTYKEASGEICGGVACGEKGDVEEGERCYDTRGCICRIDGEEEEIGFFQPCGQLLSPSPVVKKCLYNIPVNIGPKEEIEPSENVQISAEGQCDLTSLSSSKGTHCYLEVVGSENCPVISFTETADEENCYYTVTLDGNAMSFELASEGSSEVLCPEGGASNIATTLRTGELCKGSEKDSEGKCEPIDPVTIEPTRIESDELCCYTSTLKLDNQGEYCCDPEDRGLAPTCGDIVEAGSCPSKISAYEWSMLQASSLVQCFSYDGNEDCITHQGDECRNAVNHSRSDMDEDKKYNKYINCLGPELYAKKARGEEGVTHNPSAEKCNCDGKKDLFYATVKLVGKEASVGVCIPSDYLNANSIYGEDCSTMYRKGDFTIDKQVVAFTMAGHAGSARPWHQGASRGESIGGDYCCCSAVAGLNLFGILAIDVEGSKCDDTFCKKKGYSSKVAWNNNCNSVFYDYEYCWDASTLKLYTFVSPSNQPNLGCPLGLKSVTTAPGGHVDQIRVDGTVYVCVDFGGGVKGFRKQGESVAGEKGGVIRFTDCNSGSSVHPSVKGISTYDPFVLGVFDKGGDSEDEQTSFLFLPETGMYKLAGEYDNSTMLSEGNTSTYFYLDNNNIPGYQFPEDINNPKDNEDILIDQSAIVLNVTQTTSAKQYNLKKGINIISFDFFPSEGEQTQLMSNRFLELVNQSGYKVSRISYFGAGQWDGGNTYDFETGKVKGAPFALSQGKGYVIVAERDTTITVPGYKTNTPIPIAFSSGWNLIGVHGHDTQYTAKSLINSVNSIEGLKANNVTYWPTSKGMYQGFQLSEGQEYGQDFPISKDLGYFVRINEIKKDCKSIWWNPDGEGNGKCN